MSVSPTSPEGSVVDEITRLDPKIRIALGRVLKNSFLENDSTPQTKGQAPPSVSSLASIVGNLSLIKNLPDHANDIGEITEKVSDIIDLTSHLQNVGITNDAQNAGIDNKLLNIDVNGENLKHVQKIIDINILQPLKTIISIIESKLPHNTRHEDYRTSAQTIASSLYQRLYRQFIEPQAIRFVSSDGGLDFKVTTPNPLATAPSHT